jgi:[NiFe] hydrogenase diaphorase moiety large subunit
MNDLKELRNWGMIMKTTSRCGLGKTASNSVIQSIEKFEDYFKARFSGIDNSTYQKFDHKAAIAEYERYKP